jgi:hypothetical protein
VTLLQTGHPHGVEQSQETELQDLRDEVAALLAEALRVADATHAESDRVQDAHDDEMNAAQKAHGEELTASQERHDVEMTSERHTHDDGMHHMDVALGTRDLIGQAKGIIMVTMLCDADKAFGLIRAQSQAENRKAIEIAAEIAARITRRAAG